MPLSVMGQGVGGQRRHCRYTSKYCIYIHMYFISLAILISSSFFSAFRDSHIRLDLMAQLQDVLGSDNVTPTIVKPQLKNIVNDAILPNLTWRVGVVAATLRKVAVACLYTIFHGGKLDTEAAYSLGPSLLPVLNTNLEDGDATVRRLCCLNMHMILHLLPGALGEDPIRLLFPELLKRLDDSNDDVRLAACEAINSLFMATPKVHLQGTPLEYSVEQLLIHLDDQDASIQVSIPKKLTRRGKFPRPF